MGKPTGFLEFARVPEHYQPVTQRIQHYQEFVSGLDPQQAQQQSARCMDCGIPFCHNACPVNNIIPDWNDLVYQDQWQAALQVLHSTNNFPEFTGRICPAPCEAACTLGINALPVGIKSIEQAIIDRGWEQDWIKPVIAQHKTGKRIAVVGSGPAGLAAAQQLARAGHEVTVLEKNSRIGGLLRYGIPDFKLDKSLIDRRIQQMQAEGVVFRTQVLAGECTFPAGIANDAQQQLSVAQLQAEFDAIILAGGAETPRDLPIPGRALQGVHFALEWLIPQNKAVAQDAPNPIHAQGKHVVVIGGGDTGSDCVGTAQRHGAASVTQLELMPQPPEQEDKALTWPYWPYKLRTSSSHQEGCQREFAITSLAFLDNGQGQVKALQAARLAWQDGKMSIIAGSEFELPADLVLLATGFTAPVASLLDSFGVQRDARGNAAVPCEGPQPYTSHVDKVFTAGDMRRGQSLVVWAIREGRQCAQVVDKFLMGRSDLAG